MLTLLKQDVGAGCRGVAMRSKVSRIGRLYLGCMPNPYAHENIKLQYEAFGTMMMEFRNTIAIPCYIVLLSQNDNII